MYRHEAGDPYQGAAGRGQHDVRAPVDWVPHTVNCAENCDQQKARLYLQPTVYARSWEWWGGGLETGEQGQGGPEADYSQGGLHVPWWAIVE